LLRITSNDMSFKYDNEPSNSVKGGISWWGYYLLLKQYYAIWS
jgi:hypothetical protein